MEQLFDPHRSCAHPLRLLVCLCSQTPATRLRIVTVMGCAAINEADQEPQRAYSPASRLYRHALESIFQFCSLKELHAILAVSRDWSAAVQSMPSIRANHWLWSVDQLSLIAGGRMARHVVEVSGDCVSAPAGLRLLADRMPWLQRHQFRWSPERGDCGEESLVLSRLRQLQSCSMDLYDFADASDQHAAAANHLIWAAGWMSHLEDLSLLIRCHDDRISFSALVGLARLRTFSMTAFHRRSAVPSDEQVAALRQMHSLERFSHTFTDRNGTLRLLLQAPTPPLRWTSTFIGSGASDLVPLLQSLPALTELDVHCVCGNVDWLLSMPQVRSLTLRKNFGHVLPADALERIVATLQRCPHLTALHLDVLDFTSAQISSLFSTLPGLSTLSLSFLDAVDSLRFLATDALAASLTDLTVLMTCDKVTSAEIVHLLGLRSLRKLLLRLCETPSEAHKAQLRAVHPFVSL